MDDTRDPSGVAFPRLDEEELAALAPLGERRRLRDGEPLFQAGESRGGFFVVLSGAVEVLDRSGGEARSVTLHGPGEFTGDIDILSRRPPVVSAVARGATEVLGVSSEDVRRIIAERPQLGERILKAFIARRELLVESGFRGVRVIGSERDRAAFRIREFLARNQVPFTWIDVDEEPGVGELLRRFGLGERDLPVVAYDAHPLLRRPSIGALAEALGVKQPLDGGAYDLVIVGAGPAGLAAAVYGASEGLRVLALDGAAPGGQAGAASKIENYLGFPTGISGEDLVERATLQARKFGASISAPARVAGLDLRGARFVVEVEGGERVEARSVLIATGAAYRRLDVPGRARFDGVGVYYAATQTELSACGGSDVVVVGGGNSAGQAVMFLAEHTRRVVLLLRGGDLRKSMSSYLADRIEEAPNVDVLLHTQVRAMTGDERLEAVEVEDARTGERRTIRTPAVFSFIGAVPHTRWLPPEIETDRKGFVLTGRRAARSPRWAADREPHLLETTHPGVFAAGDVRLGSVKRVASAVGEGSMAVKYIHEYLSDEQERAARAREAARPTGRPTPPER